MRYQFSPATSVSFGYSGTVAGKSFVNGLPTRFETRVDHLRVFASTFLTPILQVQGMVGTDIHVEGGFRNAVVTQLRLVKLF